MGVKEGPFCRVWIGPTVGQFLNPVWLNARASDDITFVTGKAQNTAPKRGTTLTKISAKSRGLNQGGGWARRTSHVTSFPNLFWSFLFHNSTDKSNYEGGNLCIFN